MIKSWLVALAFMTAFIAMPFRTVAVEVKDASGLRKSIDADNTIGNVNQSHANQDGAVTLAASYKNHFIGLPGGDRDITIMNNTFEKNDGINLLVSKPGRYFR